MIPLQWTSNIANSPKAKKDFEDYLANSSRLLERLREIINEKENSLTKIQFSPSTYKNPSWAYEQAFLNGRLTELNDLKQLLTLG